MSVFVQQRAPSSVTLAHRSLMPHWLTHLGFLGLFSVAVVDSSVIPLPLPGSTDLLLLWLVAHSGDPWLLAPCAIAGSLLGGYTTWQIGRRGGERGAAALCAGASSWAHRRVGGTSSSSCSLCSRAASSADSTLAVCARLGSVGGLAPAFSRGLRRGSQPALLVDRVARRGLRTQRRPAVFWNPSEMVDASALRLRGPAGHRPLFGNMEDSQAAQDRCHG
jgi:hypothetical protein